MNNVYMKLAKTNIRNNRALYIPYIFSGIVSVTLFYLMLFLNNNRGLSKMPSAVTVQSIMFSGVVLIGIFAYIFLFYTNSFIIKRRKKEIGIYNILGMEKRHIARVLGIETIFCGVVSIAGGIVVGLVFSRFMLMLLYKILAFKQTIAFEINTQTISNTIIIFGILFLILLCYNLMQIKLAKPVELLRGGNVGEKEPKTKLLMAILGIICIGTGYAISIFTKNPLQVVSLFFVAVTLVVIGTFFLFIAGSIVLLKMLRKNKSFYYNKKYFSAVSGMLYRMKQNAAGLASICILSTMVLVMISTTISMFVGIDEEISNRYPYDCIITEEYASVEDAVAANSEEKIKKAFSQTGRKMENELAYYSMDMMMKQEKGIFAGLSKKIYNGRNYWMTFYTRENLIKSDEQFTEENVPQIQKGKVLIYSPDDYKEKNITLMNQTYSVQQVKKYGAKQDEYMMNMFQGAYYVVVDSDETMKKLFEEQKKLYPEAKYYYKCTIQFDVPGTRQQKIKAIEKTYQKRFEKSDDLFKEVTLDDRAENEQDFFAIYGGLFFLGVFLGSMFLAVTVMIIFYKQISEGYDDKERYMIMEKVGMSSQEVKKTIHSQILIVFFLPITVAVLHVIAAFPMIRRLLVLLNLTNTVLFIQCLIGTVLVFTIIYLLVYVLTSKAYYRIVGNQVK